MKDFFFQFFTWWNGQTLGTRFYTWRHGKKIGQDETGNTYFEGKKQSDGSIRRWVIYNGVSDPSSIPPGWHAWIHRRSNKAPPEENYKPYPWEKKHQPNKTGTAFSFRPKSSIFRNGQRPKVSADYKPWNPHEEL